MRKYQQVSKAFLLLIFVSILPANGRNNLLKYIDTRVGTAAAQTKQAGKFGKGSEEYPQIIPAVLEPNGMNFWTPQTRDTEQKCIAPYYYKDSLMQGFRNSHFVSGSCVQDYGSMTLMPVSGVLKCQPDERASRFNHEKETATPAYYSVFLEDYKIIAEITGTSRSALFRFRYENGNAYLVVNPNSDEGEGFIEIDTEKKEIRGYNPVHRIYQGWGQPAGFRGYFIIRFRENILSYGTFDDEKIYENQTQIEKKKKIGVYVKLDIPKNKEAIIKAASSFTGMDGAKLNMETEIPGWDFNRVRSRLESKWNESLAKIIIKTDNEVNRRKFYGAMYRTSFDPHVMNDVDGSYPAFSKGVPIMKMKNGDYYDDFSMWDIYRALLPLHTILEPQKTGEMMQSLTLKYEQGGWLPIFPCWNSYTAAMIGDHCIAALADAYVKGVRNFDVEKAFEGALKNAFVSPSNFEDYKNGMGRRALDSYLKYGYIPLEDNVNEAFHRNEQVSRTLEYAFDDFALAQWADSLKKKPEAESLKKRAKNYVNVIDPATGWARGRHDDGTFIKPFNPFESASFITEGSPCHYTWYVPQDVYGLMKMMGGKENYIAKLDTMFSGHFYWHGNEPCHQVAFMFNYAGEPWKTQKEVRHVMDTEYLDVPGGLSGNDDSGQMSAWYIFASLGFYPVCPATPYYILASPSFEKAVIHLENGKIFTIIAHGASEKNIYIHSAKLNGKNYTKNYITHQDIANGGTLEFVMDANPNKTWGSQPEDCPPPVL